MATNAARDSMSFWSAADDFRLRNPATALAEALAGGGTLELGGVGVLLLLLAWYARGRVRNARVVDRVWTRVLAPLEDEGVMDDVGTTSVRVVCSRRCDPTCEWVLDKMEGVADVIVGEVEFPKDADVAPLVCGIRAVGWGPDRDLKLYAHRDAQLVGLPRDLRVTTEHPDAEKRVFSTRFLDAVRVLPSGTVQCVHCTDQFDFADPDVPRPWRGVKFCVRVLPGVLDDDVQVKALQTLVRELVGSVPRAMLSKDVLSEDARKQGEASRERVRKLMAS